jgi:hypothetical protein
VWNWPSGKHGISSVEPLDSGARELESLFWSLHEKSVSLIMIVFL